MGSNTAQREFSRGTTELAVLALIRDKRRYGYDLMREFADATDGALEVKEGTLYPVLHRLEDGGFIEASWEAEGRGAPRKYYGITQEGKERLTMLRAEWNRLSDGMARLLNGGKRR
jgi:PadR family transcriptional regulator, regulatory protein PadR